ncbi:hypothetical protein ACIBI9_46780 [Nonomuraea sp. NPDC050451]|uniref:hypothetical protein n=1 Tax=Nonomuraea sp. NPDC050451 TaxID=3364364 RepID=UPI00379C881F
MWAVHFFGPFVRSGSSPGGVLVWPGGSLSVGPAVGSAAGSVAGPVLGASVLGRGVGRADCGEVCPDVADGLTWPVALGVGRRDGGRVVSGRVTEGVGCSDRVGEGVGERSGEAVPSDAPRLSPGQPFTESVVLENIPAITTASSARARTLAAIEPIMISLRRRPLWLTKTAVGLCCSGGTRKS